MRTLIFALIVCLAGCNAPKSSLEMRVSALEQSAAATGTRSEWVLWMAQSDVQKDREPVFYPDTVFEDEATCNRVADAMVKSGDPKAPAGTRTVVQGSAGAYFVTRYSCLPRWLDPRPPR